MRPFISIQESFFFFFFCRWLISINFVGPVYKLLPVERFGGLRVSENESLILTDDLQPMASGFRKYVDEHQFSY